MSKAKYKQGRKIESVADFEKSKCIYFKVYSSPYFHNSDVGKPPRASP